jgi:acyl-CoA thioesterase I
MRMPVRRIAVGILLIGLAAPLGGGVAHAAEAIIVALGASHTYGKGVARNEAYPAQLEALLRVKGYAVRVINAGVNGDTTAGMLARLERAVPSGTKVVILQPGGNDRRKGQSMDRADNVAVLQARLKARSVNVVMLEDNMLRGLPHQPDKHLTPEGYRALAENLLPQVVAALGR